MTTLEPPLTCVATTTWNSGGVVEPFLEHCKKIGFDRVFITDIGSEDNTMALVAEPKWSGFANMVEFSGIRGMDTSNDMLRFIRSSFPTIKWCLFCDPDEYLVTPAMNVYDVFKAGEESNSLQLKRYNMTTIQSKIVELGKMSSALNHLNLKIVARQCRHEPLDKRIYESLSPPWIFTEIGNKVFVDIHHTLAIGEGDHSSLAADPRARSTVAEDCHLLHFPFTSFDSFSRKVDLARKMFSENPQLPLGHGWQYRRWIWQKEQGLLYQEYLDQFIDDTRALVMLRNGKIVIDDSLQSL